MKLERNHKGWERCWNVVAREYGDRHCLYNCEVWQYLNTEGDGIVEAAYHVFRHRDLDGRRRFFDIPVESGDFEEV